MEWIWREKPDGTRGLGYPVYLAGGLAAWGLIYLLHERLTPPSLPRAAPASAHHRGAEVASITGAAAMAAPVVEPEAPEGNDKRSYRLRSADRSERHAKRHASERADATDGEIDAIGETLHPHAAAAAASRSNDGFTALPPAFPPEAEGEEHARAPHPKLLDYRDPAADSDAPTRAAEAKLQLLLARGTLVPVYLLTTVDTSNPAAVLQFAVAEDVAAHGTCGLEMGTRLLGRFSGHPMRGRLSVIADTVQFPNGDHHPIQATAVEADPLGANIRPGLAAEYVPPPTFAQLAPYISDFATGFLGLLQTRAQQGVTLGLNGITLGSSVTNDAKGPAYQATAQAIGDYTHERLREYEERYAAYYLIPAGTACWMQLDADYVGTLSHAL
ncbi:MAG TPA: TrbI/VirB10 family protein [Opitutaceae bacterium]|jgi:hypothetical protein